MWILANIAGRLSNTNQSTSLIRSFYTRLLELTIEPQITSTSGFELGMQVFVNKDGNCNDIGCIHGIIFLWIRQNQNNNTSFYFSRYTELIFRSLPYSFITLSSSMPRDLSDVRFVSLGNGCTSLAADKVWSFTTAAGPPPSCTNLPVSTITSNGSQRIYHRRSLMQQRPVIRLIFTHKYW